MTKDEIRAMIWVELRRQSSDNYHPDGASMLCVSEHADGWVSADGLLDCDALAQRIAERIKESNV